MAFLAATIGLPKPSEFWAVLPNWVRLTQVVLHPITTISLLARFLPALVRGFTTSPDDLKTPITSQKESLLMLPRSLIPTKL